MNNFPKRSEETYRGKKVRPLRDCPFCAAFDEGKFVLCNILAKTALKEGKEKDCWYPKNTIPIFNEKPE